MAYYMNNGSAYMVAFAGSSRNPSSFDLEHNHHLYMTNTNNMSTSNVSFVIVPGSFTTPQLYDDLLAVFHKQGRDAQVVPLESANDGTRQPPATADDDAARIRDAVTTLLDHPTHPKDVVLAAHSYGGVPASSALRGLSKADRVAAGKTTAVVGIVYIASFVLPLGQEYRAFLNAAHDNPIMQPLPGQYLPELDPGIASVLFNDIADEGERLRYFRMSTRQSSDSFDGVVKYEPWKDISSVYLIPGEDLIVPTALQEKMYEQAKEAGGKISKVLVEGAGHAITNSQPELVVQQMIKLA